MRSLFTLLVLCCIPTLLSAQLPDVRLTPNVPRPSLPTESMIQDGAQVGSTTLVAWGSTMTEGDSVVSVLVVQRVQGGVPLGTPEVICESYGRPVGWVRVVALDNRFLVVWNDRRSLAPGVYARLVESDGTFGEEEQLFAELLPEAPMWHRWSTNLTLFFGTLYSHSLLIRLDPVNASIVGRDTMMGDFGAVRSVPQFPGQELLLDRYAGSPATLVDMNTGGFVALDSVVAARLTGSYHLSPNGELATYRNDTVRVYTSLTDNVPARTFRAPTRVDSIRPVLDLVLLSRDAAGRYQLDYCEAAKIDGAGGSNFYLYAIRMRVNGAGQSDSSWMVCQSLIASAYTAPASVAPYRGWYEVDADGWHGANVTMQYSNFNPPPNNSTVAERVIGVQTDGRPAGYAGFDQGCSLYASGRPNALPGAVHVERVLDSSDAGHSIVEVIEDSLPIRLRREVGIVFVAEFSRQPSFHLVGDTLLLAWNSTELFVPTNTHARLGVMQGVAQPVAELPDLQWRNLDAGAKFTMLTREGSTSAQIVTDSGLVLATPTPAGWHLAPRLDNAGKVVATGYDPNRREWTVAAEHREKPMALTVAAVDAAGAIAWRVDSTMPNMTAPLALVPLDSAVWLVPDNGAIRRFAGATETALWSPPSFSRIGKDGAYYRLLGGRFLYIAWQDLNASLDVAVIEPSDTGLRLVRSHSLMSFVIPPPSIAVAQIPSDSSILLVYGGVAGVRLIQLNRALNEILDNFQISQSQSTVDGVAAVVLHDTLFVAWEDRRDAVGQIYGQAFPLSQVFAAVPPGASSAERELQLDVAPLPASERLEVRAAEGFSTLRLVAGDGTVVWQEEAVVGNRAVLDVRGLSAGVYVLEGRSGEQWVRRKVLVMH